MPHGCECGFVCRRKCLSSVGSTFLKDCQCLIEDAARPHCRAHLHISVLALGVLSRLRCCCCCWVNNCHCFRWHVPLVLPCNTPPSCSFLLLRHERPFILCFHRCFFPLPSCHVRRFCQEISLFHPNNILTVRQIHQICRYLTRQLFISYL